MTSSANPAPDDETCSEMACNDGATPDLAGQDFTGPALTQLYECADSRFTAMVAASGIDPARDLRFHDLTGIEIRPEEDVAGYDFTGCLLHDAILRDVDFRRAIMTGADLEGADTEGALFPEGFDPAAEEKEQDLSLLRAVIAGDAGEVKRLLDAGADPEQTDENGMFPLFVAADEAGTGEPFRTGLSRAGDRLSQGRNYEEIVIALLGKGAHPVRAHLRSGLSPLDIIRNRNLAEVICTDLIDRYMKTLSMDNFEYIIECYLFVTQWSLITGNSKRASEFLSMAMEFCIHDSPEYLFLTFDSMKKIHILHDDEIYYTCGRFMNDLSYVIYRRFGPKNHINTYRRILKYFSFWVEHKLILNIKYDPMQPHKII